MNIGDRVRTTVDLKGHDGRISLPKGAVGTIRTVLSKTEHGGKFIVHFRGLPVDFNFWADELQLVREAMRRRRRRGRREV